MDRDKMYDSIDRMGKKQREIKRDRLRLKREGQCNLRIQNSSINFQNANLERNKASGNYIESENDYNLSLLTFS